MPGFNAEALLLASNTNGYWLKYKAVSDNAITLETRNPCSPCDGRTARPDPTYPGQWIMTCYDSDPYTGECLEKDVYIGGSSYCVKRWLNCCEYGPGSDSC